MTRIPLLRPRLPIAVVLLLLLLLLRVAPAVAEEPAQKLPETTATDAAPDPRKVEAEERRLRALRLYDSGNYSAARGEFERANQLMPSFRLLYNLGVVCMALGDTAAAYDFFDRYLVEGGSQIAPDLRAEVELQVQDLREQIATVTVLVDSPGSQIFVDETLVGNAPLTRPLHVNVGFRKIWARSPGARTASRSLALAGGQSVRVELEVAAPPRKDASPPTKVFWAGWAATAVLAAGATFTGVEALASQREYQRTIGAVGTTRAELDALDSRTTRWSVATDVLGVAALAIGSYSLYVTLRRPDSPQKRAATPGVQVLGSQVRLTVRF